MAIWTEATATCFSRCSACPVLPGTVEERLRASQVPDGVREIDKLTSISAWPLCRFLCRSLVVLSGEPRRKKGGIIRREFHYCILSRHVSPSFRAFAWRRLIAGSMKPGRTSPFSSATWSCCFQPHPSTFSHHNPHIFYPTELRGTTYRLSFVSPFDVFHNYLAKLRNGHFFHNGTWQAPAHKKRQLRVQVQHLILGLTTPAALSLLTQFFHVSSKL